MTKTLVVIWLTALAGTLAACSSKDVCAEAGDKVRSCIDKLDCTKITDITKKAICEGAKTYKPVTVEDCKKANPGNPSACECKGDVKTQAEAMAKCTLDPETCTCPTTKSDSGPQLDGFNLGDM